MTILNTYSLHPLTSNSGLVVCVREPHSYVCNVRDTELWLGCACLATSFSTYHLRIHSPFYMVWTSEVGALRMETTPAKGVAWDLNPPKHVLGGY